MQCIALHTALHCTARHGTALHCIVLHCTVIQYSDFTKGCTLFSRKWRLLWPDVGEPAGACCPPGCRGSRCSGRWGPHWGSQTGVSQCEISKANVAQFLSSFFHLKKFKIFIILRQHILLKTLVFNLNIVLAFKFNISNAVKRDWDRPCTLTSAGPSTCWV